MNELAQLGEIAKAHDYQFGKSVFSRHKDIPDAREAMDEGYRSSIFEPVNPRSVTQVKEGSELRRGGRYFGGGVGGALLGTGLGALTKNPQAMKVGSALGSAAGVNVGHHYNRKSGDTRAFQRSTGKRNTGKVQIPYVPGMYNIY